jgi:hypothetical protein
MHMYSHPLSVSIIYAHIHWKPLVGGRAFSCPICVLKGWSNVCGRGSGPRRIPHTYTSIPSGGVSCGGIWAIHVTDLRLLYRLLSGRREGGDPQP